MSTNDAPGCLAPLLKLFGVAPEAAPAGDALPYRRKDYLLSQAERSFYGVLQ